MINISETDPISENNKNETNVTPTSEEQFDFTSFSLDELIDKTKELIKVELVYTVSKDIERLKALFYKKLNEEKSMARTSFLEGGGEESLFVFDNSLESSFKNIYKLRFAGQFLENGNVISMPANETTRIWIFSASLFRMMRCVVFLRCKMRPALRW